MPTFFLVEKFLFFPLYYLSYLSATMDSLLANKSPCRINVL